jgi:hypothetical protein
MRQCESLFPFPSFEMDPKLFEAAVAAVLAARLNALRSTKGERITVADIFPDCSMAPDWGSIELGALPGQFGLLKEKAGGGRRASASDATLVLSGHVTWLPNVTCKLEETVGSVLRCAKGAKCIDVHFVLPQPRTERLAHFAIQCKSGVSVRFDALAMYEEAMTYMASVAGMDHYFVLAALQPDRVQRPLEAQWPDGLIVVDSMAEFAPLMRAMPPEDDATRSNDVEGDNTASRRC